MSSGQRHAGPRSKTRSLAATKEKKTNGKTLVHPDSEPKRKTPDPKETRPGSPQKGESSHNRYVRLNLEGNVEEIRESQEENNRKGQEEAGEGNSKGKVKEKEVLDLSGDSSKSLPNQTLENPEMSEEERQDTSESDSDWS
jgi:hypothetical protein